MADNAGSDPSDDESDPSDDEFDIFSDDDSDTSEVYVYRGRGSVPKNVRRVEVDRCVKFIPDYLFGECERLESVLLHEGLLKIGECAFQRCSSLRNIKIPSTVIKIGKYAFYECSSLVTAELPKGTREIERGAFIYCTSLEEVTIPASVALIGDNAFEGCTNLTSIELREGLRMIGDQAFDGCSSLGRLRVPLSVDEIGKWAFADCSTLALVQMSEHLPKMKPFAFSGCPLESFQFFPLLERMEAIGMDDQTKSMFESRLREITLAFTGEDRDREDEYDSDEEEDFKVVQENCRNSLGRAHEFLTYLDLKGAAPVLELALWKSKIEGSGGEGVRGDLVNNKNGGQDTSDAGRERKRPKVTKNVGQDIQLSRKDCRVKCGAGIVIPEVLKFFTYSSSWPRLDHLEGGNVN